MRIGIDEQETVINIMRDEDRAYIYTSDTTMMTKFDKLVNESEVWKLAEIIRMGGDVVGKKYTCPKKFVSYRSKVVKRELTDEQKQGLAARLKQARNYKNN